MRTAQLLFSGSFAGAEAVGCKLAQALSRRTGDALLCVVAETRAGRASCDELLARARSFDTELLTFETNARRDPALKQALGTALHERKIDILHNHSYKGAIMLRGFKGPNTKNGGNIYTAHGFDHTDPRTMAFQYATTAASLIFADRTIAVSDNVADTCKKLMPFRARPTVIQNLSMEPLPAIATPEQRTQARATLAQRHAIPPDAIWIGIAARLVPIKNHLALIDAICTAAQALPDKPLAFLIAGDGPLRAELETKAAHANAKQSGAHIHCLGQVSDIDAFYRAIDINILGSSSEGSPLAIIEALGHGKPVIASGVGSIPELIQSGETGRLFDAGDWQTCTSHLIELAQSEPLRDELGRAGRNHLERTHSPDDWVDRYRALYDTVRTP